MALKEILMKWSLKIKNSRYVPESLKLKIFIYREKKFLDGIRKEQKGLEIGPSHSPVVPKKEGYHVENVDWLDQAGLREHYKNDHVNLDTIEPVDYVWKGGSYSQLIQKSNYYDYIIASHMIEHTTNFAGFLQDCSNLLKRDGILRLAVPDKRYCFDHYRYTTSIAEVLNNACMPNDLQSVGNVAEYYMNVVQRKGQISWNKPALSVFDFLMKHRYRDYRFIHGKGLIMDEMRRACENQYIDIHHYVFTPASFELLIYDLRVLEVIDMKITHMWNTRRNEFIVTLQKTAEKEELDISYRQQLLRARDKQNRIF